jgi:hypothetical protein
MAGDDPGGGPAWERVPGPTPAGGTYAQVYYTDAEGNLVPKGRAVAAEVVEYAADGDVVDRTYGTFPRGGPATRPRL